MLDPLLLTDTLPASRDEAIEAAVNGMDLGTRDVVIVIARSFAGNCRYYESISPPYLGHDLRSHCQHSIYFQELFDLRHSAGSHGRLVLGLGTRTSQPNVLFLAGSDRFLCSSCSSF